MRETTKAEAHLNGGNQQAKLAAEIGEGDRRGSSSSPAEAERMGKVGENAKEKLASKMAHLTLA